MGKPLIRARWKLLTPYIPIGCQRLSALSESPITITILRLSVRKSTCVCACACVRVGVCKSDCPKSGSFASNSDFVIVPTKSRGKWSFCRLILRYGWSHWWFQDRRERRFSVEKLGKKWRKLSLPCNGSRSSVEFGAPAFHGATLCILGIISVIKKFNAWVLSLICH